MKKTDQKIYNLRLGEYRQDLNDPFTKLYPKHKRTKASAFRLVTLKNRANPTLNQEGIHMSESTWYGVSEPKRCKDTSTEGEGTAAMGDCTLCTEELTK